MTEDMVFFQYNTCFNTLVYLHMEISKQCFQLIKKNDYFCSLKN